MRSVLSQFGRAHVRSFLGTPFILWTTTVSIFSSGLCSRVFRGVWYPAAQRSVSTGSSLVSSRRHILWYLHKQPIVHSVPPLSPLFPPEPAAQPSFPANFPCRLCMVRGAQERAFTCSLHQRLQPIFLFLNKPTIPYHTIIHHALIHSLGDTSFCSVIFNNTIRTLPYTATTNPRRFPSLINSSKVLANSLSLRCDTILQLDTFRHRKSLEAEAPYNEPDIAISAESPPA